MHSFSWEIKKNETYEAYFLKKADFYQKYFKNRYFLFKIIFYAKSTK